MTDRELLEAAARAAELELRWQDGRPNVGDWLSRKWWNPLEDDGDALRLAVKLEIELHLYAGREVDAKYDGRRKTCSEPWGIDGMEATRRAIVRAAASMSPDLSAGGREGVR